MNDRYSGTGVAILGILLAAAGAVLRYAVYTSVTKSVNIHTLGTIVLVVGVLVFLLGVTLLVIRAGPQQRPPGG